MNPQTDMAAQLTAWLTQLPAQERDDLARRYATRTREGGATLLRPGQSIPIPPLLTPEILDGRRIAEMEHNAHSLLSGLSRLTRWLMSDAGTTTRARLFCAFGEYEAKALATTWREAERLVTARVDYLVDENGQPRALEVNATIPAMQGYSDIVAAAFLAEVGRVRGLSAATCARLLDENRPNADQLLASLLAHYRLLGGKKERPSIAMVAREGDSQLGELGYMATRFQMLGSPTVLVTPGDLRLDPSRDGRLVASGAVPDLIYRHVFARRLDPASDFARACLEPRKHFILNPIASHLEAKGMLALLSSAAGSDGKKLAADAGLDGGLLEEVSRTVPWTRLLTAGPAIGPDGDALPDLLAAVAAEPGRFVLKKSWDYGGRGVFLGADHDDAAASRAATALGTEGPVGWAELVRRAAADPHDVWVAQGLVRSNRRRHLVADEATGAVWKDLYVDLSVYTNLGVEDRPHGGVSRAAPGRIVNLQGGGGLAPLIRSEVLRELLQG